MKEEAIAILKDAKIKGELSFSEQYIIKNALKYEFLRDNAFIKISSKTVSFDDFISVYFPESDAYIQSCRNITSSSLNDAFHNVLENYIEKCVRDLILNDLIELLK